VSAERGKRVDEADPWCQRRIRDVILFGKRAERDQRVSVGQKEHPRPFSAQFLEAAGFEKLMKILSCAPVTLLDLIQPILLSVRFVILRYCHVSLPAARVPPFYFP